MIRTSDGEEILPECPASLVTLQSVSWMEQHGIHKTLGIRPEKPTRRWVAAMMTIEGEWDVIEREEVERTKAGSGA